MASFAEEARPSEALTTMMEAIINGNAAGAAEAARTLLDEGMEPQTLISRGVVPAMEIVGENFETGEYFLPEMMAAALSTRAVLDHLRPLLSETGAEPVARAVIGTVKGDLHDIGKNLVGMMLEGAGFEVIDLGPDVPAEKFIAAIRDHEPHLIGMSALLTTTMPMMRTIITALEEAGVREKVKVMVGGAGVNQDFSDQIGADGFAPDASSAVRKAKEMLAIGV